MKWLKNNWFGIIIIISVALLILAVWGGRLEEKQYKKKIEMKNENIRKLENSNRADQQIIKGLEGEIKRIEVVVEEKDKARAKNEKDIVRIKRDRDKWKEKVNSLPASVVVIETRIILETYEIWEKPDGILFSLTAAKDNLAILGDFSLVEEDRDKWKDNYNIAKSEIGDLKGIVVKKDGIITKKDGQLSKKDGIIEEWKGKFNLSNSQKRKSYWKGAKAGGIVVGIISFLFGLAIGK